tara:strand:+ start:932 stop:1072 length:141 start_codon:yes stop_codon:yes gene_type:complete
MAQIKARWYYFFWGLMTLIVFSGQVYVGHNYKTMSNSVEELINTLK